MELGVLFSGGKDSSLALHRAHDIGHAIKCLISMSSKNPDSWMFHTPNVSFIEEQADAMRIPAIQYETEGNKEEDPLLSVHSYPLPGSPAVGPEFPNGYSGAFPPAGDINGDLKIDLTDFKHFQICAKGDGVPVGLECLIDDFDSDSDVDQDDYNGFDDQSVYLDDIFNP